MYINTLTNQYPVSEQDIRNDNPNVSFPSPFVPDSKYQVVFPVPQPTYNPVIQTLSEGVPNLTNKGTYAQTWTVTEIFETQEEKDAAIAADTLAKKKASVPVSVSPRQIAQALNASGLRQLVEDAVTAGDQDLKDWWNRSTTFERNNTQVIEMATTLGVTEDQLDDLWILAGTL